MRSWEDILIAPKRWAEASQWISTAPPNPGFSQGDIRSFILPLSFLIVRVYVCMRMCALVGCTHDFERGNA